VTLSEKEERDKTSLKTSLIDANVSKEVLKKTLILFDVAIENHNHFRLHELFDNTHNSLKQELMFSVTKEFLKKIPFLVTVEISVLRFLSLFVKEEIFLPGDRLMFKGDQGRMA
jgi:hypothetical protein